MSVLQLLFLGVAALLAGAINAIAGGGSLISFPALLAVGYSSVAANVTNLVALLPGYASGTAAYRAQLRGQGRRVRVLGAAAALGAATGTALLLTTSTKAFDAVVPGLVLLACALLAAQPVLARAMAGRAPASTLTVLVFLGSVYGGYFGAGLGIMLLAILAAALADDLQRLNALKGALSLVVAVVSAIAVGLFGPVAWVAALVMAVASLAGGVLGARIAQRLPATALRWGIVAYGVVLAVVLALR